MKKIILTLAACFAVTTTPTTSAVSVGTVAYKVVAGCGGLFFASNAVGFGVTSAYCGTMATLGVACACAGEPAGIVVAVPCAVGSAVSGAMSLGCAYLSYCCFKEMVAPVEPDNVVYHVHVNGTQQRA